MININNRCPPLPDDTVPGLLPGGLNAMFERILATAQRNNTHIEVIPEGLTNYSVFVHSRPAPAEGGAVVSKKVDLEQPP